MSNVKLRCPNCGELQGLKDITFSDKFIFELQCVFCESWIMLAMFAGNLEKTRTIELSATQEVENDND
jgi:hypothetical protein